MLCVIVMGAAQAYFEAASRPNYVQKISVFSPAPLGRGADSESQSSEASVSRAPSGKNMGSHQHHPQTEADVDAVARAIPATDGTARVVYCVSPRAATHHLSRPPDQVLPLGVCMIAAIFNCVCTRCIVPKRTDERPERCAHENVAQIKRSGRFPPARKMHPLHEPL